MFKEPQPLDRKIYDVSQGVARTFTRKVFDESGYAITGFTGSEIFIVEIATGFQGGITDEAPSAAWTVPTDGEYQISVPGLESRTGIYSLRVILNPNGQPCYPQNREVFRGFLRVNASPQDSPVDCLKVYCDYGDLLEKAPYLESTHTDNDLSGFSKQRYRAKLWIDSIITRASSNTSFYGLNAINYGVVSPDAYGSSRVAQLLDENKLIVSPPIRDAAAHYTLYLITNALSSTPTTGSYQEISQKHYSLANSIMQSSVATFDSSGTGVPSYAIDLRIADGRSSF